MNYQQARIFIISIIILLVLFITALIFRPRSGTQQVNQPTDSVEVVDEPDEIEVNTPDTSAIVSLHISQRVGNLARQFSDLNADHLIHAARIGISPIRSTRDIMRLSKPIIEVESGDNYHIDKLSHSYPYLVPEAAALLDSIGSRFNTKLAAQGGGNYKIKVTSLLRTCESVNRLKRGNINSTQNSAHLYGTTFDISYVDFYEGMLNTTKHSDGELKNLLAEVLLELRDSGKCLVKFERKQGCFHITATGQ